MNYENFMKSAVENGHVTRQGHPTEASEELRKPSVEVAGGEVSILKSAEKLFSIIGPTRTLFHRGGKVVEIVGENGRPCIRIVDPVAAQSKLEHYVQFVKAPRNPGADPQPTIITEAQARQYLASDAAAKLLPNINGILECPLLIRKKDGTPHLVQNGYDPVTGFYVQAQGTVDDISLEDACTYLKRIISDFDFATPGDCSRALASLLTPALKFGGWIQGPVPIDVAEANASQAGKSYRQKLVAALYNSQQAIVTRRQGGVGSMEESFQHHLVEGRPFVQFDNVRGRLDSQLLEAFVTADGSVPARVPYQGSININPSKHLLFISSNGFEATKDLANRASIIRIRRREGHRFQNLDGMDILALVQGNNGLFQGAIVAIIREWHRRGCPRTNETRHDMREWAQVNDWIVQNILREAPLLDGHEEAKTRASNPDLTFLRQLAVLVEQAGRLNEPLSASTLTELCQNASLAIPHLAKEHQLDEEQARKVLGRVMAKLFTADEEHHIEGLYIRRAQERTGEAGNWKPLKTYTFSRSPAPDSATTTPGDQGQPIPGARDAGPAAPDPDHTPRLSPATAGSG